MFIHRKIEKIPFNCKSAATNNIEKALCLHTVYAALSRSGMLFPYVRNTWEPCKSSVSSILFSLFFRVNIRNSSVCIILAYGFN